MLPLHIPYTVEINVTLINQSNKNWYEQIDWKRNEIANIFSECQQWQQRARRQRQSDCDRASGHTALIKRQKSEFKLQTLWWCSDADWERLRVTVLQQQGAANAKIFYRRCNHAMSTYTVQPYTSLQCFSIYVYFQFILYRAFDKNWISLLNLK